MANKFPTPKNALTAAKALELAEKYDPELELFEIYKKIDIAASGGLVSINFTDRLIPENAKTALTENGYTIEGTVISWKETE